MDYTAIQTFITSVGFPIAACCVMFWYLNKERESHQAETESLTKVLTENTQAINELKSAITALLSKEGS